MNLPPMRAASKGSDATRPSATPNENSRTTIAAKFVNAREELNFGGPNFDIEDYSFVNFAAEYEISPHLTVYGRIDNLTNEHYSEVFGFPALGRAAYGGVKVQF